MPRTVVALLAAVAAGASTLVGNVHGTVAGILCAVAVTAAGLVGYATSPFKKRRFWCQGYGRIRDKHAFELRS